MISDIHARALAAFSSTPAGIAAAGGALAQSGVIDIRLVPTWNSAPSANNYAAFREATELARLTGRAILIAGSVLVITPAGTSPTINLTNTRLVGFGRSVSSIEFRATSAEAHVAHCTSGYFSAEDIKIINTMVTPGTKGFFLDISSVSEVAVKGCHLLGHKASSSDANRSAFIYVSLAAGTSRNISFEKNIIEDYGYFILKDNASLQNIEQVNIHKNRYSGITRSAAGINSPTPGSLKYVNVCENTISMDLIADGSQCTAIDYAGGVDISIVRNKGYGALKDFIHIEEAAERLIICGNTGEFSSVVSAIFLKDNNVGSGQATYTIKNTQIYDNVFRYTGAPSSAAVAKVGDGATGIDMIFDASGHEPIIGSSIHHNHMIGFDLGYYILAKAEAGVQVHNAANNNIATSCQYGFTLNGVSGGDGENQSVLCGVGLYAMDCHINRHTFIDCVENIEILTSVSLRSTWNDLTFCYYAPGTTAKNLLPTNKTGANQTNYKADVFVTGGGCKRVYAVQYDGTTETVTQDTAQGSIYGANTVGVTHTSNRLQLVFTSGTQAGMVTAIARGTGVLVSL